jgi:anti-sigma factor RsiW
MACEEWRDKLDLYVDGELETAEAASLGLHLRSCSSCSNDVLGRVQLKRSVQTAGKRYEPRAEFRNRIAGMVATQPRPRLSWGWRIIFAPALAVLVISLAVGSYMGRQSVARQRVYSELADLHVSTLASSTPVDVLSSDRHTVKPWFQGKIPFTFDVPELQGTQFSLIGGRVAYLEQSAGAHLIFQVRQHKISVFIFPERGEKIPSLPPGPVNELSFNVESWTNGGLQYFVIGDTSPEDVRTLSKLLGARE